MLESVQESYGEFVTAAVLKDCQGDLEQAVAILLVSARIWVYGVGGTGSRARA